MLFQCFLAILEIFASIIFDHPFCGLFAFFIVFFTIQIVNPLFRMWILKFKHGNDIYYKYIPIGGIMQQMRRSFKTKGNVHIWVAEVIERQPEVKMIVCNTLKGLIYVVVDPDYYKPLYQDHHLVRKNDVSGVKDFLLNGGLLFSEGLKWKEQRAILGDHFLFSKLKQRIPMMNEVVRNKMRQQKIEKVFEFICMITGEVVTRSFFGDETKNWKIDGKEAQIEVGDVFSTFIKLRFSNLFVYFKQKFLGKYSWNYCTKPEKELLMRVNRVKNDIKDIIKKRINNQKSKRENQIEDRDFLDVQLDILINQNQKTEDQITIDDIVAQFATLFLGGTDTTAALIANTLYLLSENTNFIQDLRDEVKSLLKDDNDVITSQNINKLILIEAALKETLRIKPSVVYPVPRVANQDFYIQNILIKKGDAFLIANSFANTKQRYYDNPFQYNPKRWLQSQTIKEDNGFINIPFAAGGRNCIGQHMAMIEARIILAYIIKDYNITRNPNVQKTQWPSRGVSTFLPPDAVHLQKI